MFGWVHIILQGIKKFGKICGIKINEEKSLASGKEEIFGGKCIPKQIPSIH